ncbi:MAG: DNA-deoxyinosine glycosylase [Candidatus Xenobiia bacterium LiM19]
MQKTLTRIYSFPPLAAPDAEILILGTMPGEASLRISEYYGHPRNQFWKILCSILDIDWQSPYPDRCEALIRRRLALWDVVADCERHGSLDSNIVSEKPNEIELFLSTHRPISRIVFNGGPAQKLFRRHFPTLYGSGCYTYHMLHSTSPACARYTYDEKLICWQKALLSV